MVHRYPDLEKPNMEDFMEDFYSIPWFEDVDMNFGSGLPSVMLHDRDPVMPVCRDEDLPPKRLHSDNFLDLTDDLGVSMPPACKRRRVSQSQGNSLALVDHNNYCASSKVSTEEDSIHPVVLRFLNGECSVVKGQGSCSRVPPIFGSSMWIENVDERPKEAESDLSSASSSPTYTSDVASASPRIGFSVNSSSDAQNQEVSSRKRGRPPAGGNRSNSTVSCTRHPSSNASSNCLPTPSPNTVLTARSKNCVLSSQKTVVLNTGASASSGHAGKKCGSGGRSTCSSGRQCGAKLVGRPGAKPTGSRGGKSASAPARKKGGPKSKVPLTPEEQQKKLEKNRQKALKEKERRRRSKDLLEQVKGYLLATFPNLLGRRTSHQRLIDTLLQLLPSLHHEHAEVKRHHSLASKCIKKSRKIKFSM